MAKSKPSNPSLTLAQQLSKLVAQAVGLQHQTDSKYMITDSMIKNILGQYKPAHKAEQDAALAYDSQIGDLRSQLGDIDPALQANLAGLDKWYGLVGQRNQEAKKANAAELAANLSSFQDASDAMLHALGSADPGAAGVAQQAVSDRAGLEAMGQAQSNFDNNLGQVYSMAAADRKSQVQSEAQAMKRELTRNLSNAMREKGLFQARSTQESNADYLDKMIQLHQMQYEQHHQGTEDQWNRLLGISNLLGMQATLPEDILAKKLANKGAQAGINNQYILNQEERERLKHFQKTYGTNDLFGSLEPGTRAKLAAEIQANMFGPMGKLTVSPEKFLQVLRKRLYGTAGYKKSPKTEAFLRSLLTPDLIDWWNKYHPAQAYHPGNPNYGVPAGPRGPLG